MKGLTPEFEGQVVFLHGLESGPNGTKGAILTSKFGAECPDFMGMDFDQRLAVMDSLYKDRTRLILVGSSMGAILAIHWAASNPQAVKGLVLIAPALGVDKAGIPACHPTPRHPTAVLAGAQDDLIPLEKIQDKFCNVVVCDDGHRMSNKETLEEIVRVTWDLATL